MTSRDTSLFKVTVDGVTRTGKTTLAAELHRCGFTVSDRGVPSMLSNDAYTSFTPEGAYVILQASTELCLTRLLSTELETDDHQVARAAIEEERSRFQVAVATLRGKRANVIVIDAELPLAEQTFRAKRFIESCRK